MGVTPTAAAVLALTILGETIPDHQGIVSWILNRQVISSEYSSFLGGFEESILTNDTNLASTYWALRALDLLGGLASVDADLASRFIVDCQAADGSFSLTPGAETGTLYHASYAVKALSYLGTEYENLMQEEDPNNPPPPLIDWRWGLIIGIIVVAAIGGLYSVRMD